MEKEKRGQKRKDMPLPQKEQGVAMEMVGLLKANIRQYAMYIALIVIFLVFGIRTNGLFLSAQNISNLINQTGYVAVLAIGMTLILIIRHIDLSVGFIAGFTGAVSAYLMFTYGFSPWVSILVSLLLGALIGLYQGSLVAFLKVPAFVTTLAGMFIFRGLLSLLTQRTGSIIVRNDVFKGISGYMPDPFSIDILGKSYHGLTVMIGVVLVAAIIYFQIKTIRSKKRYNFKTVSTPVFVIGLMAASLVVMFLVFLLADHNGIPWTAVIVGTVLLIYNFILNKTALGRYIYGIGGNPEASELSGVNVKKVTLFCFISMSTLAALAGILFTSRIGSAGTNAGVGFELDAIASAFIGGVAVTGGVGKVTNTLIGAFVITSLTSGFNLLGVDSALQYIAKGVIFIIAVAFDVVSRNKR